MKKNIFGNIVDVSHRKIFPGRICIQNGIIKEIEAQNTQYDNYILPGLIDAHVHIESSMLSPGRFAQMAVSHGTIGCVSDPHEIANVLGMEGVEYMINDGKKLPFKFYFGAPACVPATSFESSGAVLGAPQVGKLLERPEIKFLSEMMNFPGVIDKNKEVFAKIQHAKSLGKPVDGHAPGLTGRDLKRYIEAGITTDHECMNLKEAEEKISKGMIVQIREGSAAKNFEALYSLIDKYPEKVMLCSDDIHPDDLVNGHINVLIKRGLEKGLNLFNLLRAATLNPIKHYNLEVGLLQPGDQADLIVVNSIKQMQTLETYINGVLVYKNKKNRMEFTPQKPINNFIDLSVKKSDLQVIAAPGQIRIIRAYNGVLFTKEERIHPLIVGQNIVSDPTRDISKIVVVNRYKKTKPAVAFITGFGITSGALASSIAHDSHNVVAIGQTDEDLHRVINEILKRKGGIAVCNSEKLSAMSLEIGGIMTNEPPERVAINYERLNQEARKICTLMTAPFMTLSFMSLLVIPELKLGDRGLFDVVRFSETSLFVDNQQDVSKQTPDQIVS